jgi:hypothetical protein
MNLHSELAASAGNPEAARAWREAIKWRRRFKSSETARFASVIAHGVSNEMRSFLALELVDYMRREKRRRQRAAIADFVLGSLALTYVWAVILLNLQ